MWRDQVITLCCFLYCRGETMRTEVVVELFPHRRAGSKWRWGGGGWWWWHRDRLNISCYCSPPFCTCLIKMGLVIFSVKQCSGQKQHLFTFRCHSPFQMFLNLKKIKYYFTEVGYLPISLQESKPLALLRSVETHCVLHAEVEGSFWQLAQTRNVVILLQHTKGINICFLPYL